MRATTLLGVISDVHGDFAALQDALHEMGRLGVDEILCAGDILDWGPSPGRCIDLLRQRGIVCVRGNYDFIDVGGELFEVPRFLGPAGVAFIDALPRSYERTIAGVRLVVTHGTPGDDQRGICPDRAVDLGAILASVSADVLVVGHTHVPMNLKAPQGSIVNPGSILRQPPSTERLPASGTFGVLELPSRQFSVHRASDGAEIDCARLPFPAGAYPTSHR